MKSLLKLSLQHGSLNPLSTKSVYVPTLIIHAKHQKRIYATPKLAIWQQ